MFSYLYKSFYDRTLFASYVKQGRGYGFQPLFFLAFTVAAVMAVKISALLFSISPDVVSAAVDELDMPDFVIEKGVIVSPADYKKSFIDKESDFFFVIDTSGDPAQTDGLPKNGVYITNDAVTTYSLTKVTRFPIASLTEGADLTVGKDMLKKAGAEFIGLCRRIVPPTMFVFVVPVLWAYYFLAAVFYGLMSFILTFSSKTSLIWEERLRLATLSVMPAYVLNACAYVFGASVPAYLNVVIIAVYMICFLQDGKKSAAGNDVPAA